MIRNSPEAIEAVAGAASCVLFMVAFICVGEGLDAKKRKLVAASVPLLVLALALMYVAVGVR